MKEIKSLLQQAEVYRDQGLLQEAMEKYNIASELILKSDQIKNRQNLIHVISKKMGALENDFKKKNKPASRKMPIKTQELIKSKKFFSKKMGKKEAALEGALNLAKFGQYKRALKELKNLISVDSIRVNAAKNIVRCHMALSSPNDQIICLKMINWKKLDIFLKAALRKRGLKKLFQNLKKLQNPNTIILKKWKKKFLI